MKKMLAEYMRDYKTSKTNKSFTFAVGALAGMMIIESDVRPSDGWGLYFTTILKLYAVAIPFIMEFMALIYHRFDLPKMMKICPIEKGDKKKYLYNKYYTKLAVNAVIAIIEGLLLTMFYKLQLHVVIVVVVAAITLAVIVQPAGLQGVSPARRTEVKGYTAFVMIIVLMMIGVGIAFDIRDGIVIYIIEFFVAYVLVGIPLIRYNLKLLKQHIEGEIE